MLYTSYYNSKKLSKAIDDGRFIVSISRTEPEWLEVDSKMFLLAPTKELFNRSYDMTMEEFSIEYCELLENNKENVLKVLKWLESMDGIMCCWCKDYASCHRSVLASWAKKYNIIIKEL